MDSGDDRSVRQIAEDCENCEVEADDPLVAEFGEREAVELRDGSLSYETTIRPCDEHKPVFRETVNEVGA